MSETNEHSAVGAAERREQLKLVYDYIKFHIGLYLATPAAVSILADALDIKRKPIFVTGLILCILVFLFAGAHAAIFISRHILHPWKPGYLERFEAEAFSQRRMVIHHWLYWLGFVLAVSGLLIAWLQS